MTTLPQNRDSYQAEKLRYLRFSEDHVTQRSGEHEPIRTTPIFSLAVKYAVDRVPPRHIDLPNDEADATFSSAGAESEDGIAYGTTLATLDADQMHSASREIPLLPQYGLLGFEIDENDERKPPEPIMINVLPQTPFSFVVRKAAAKAILWPAFWKASCYPIPALGGCSNQSPVWCFIMIPTLLERLQRSFILLRVE